MLNKHFEKLAQCDPQFNMLIQEKDIILDSPFFETMSSIFEELNDVKSHDFSCLKVDQTSMFLGFHGAGSPCSIQSTSCTMDIHNGVHGKPESSHSTIASSSGITIIDVWFDFEIVGYLLDHLFYHGPIQARSLDF